MCLKLIPGYKIYLCKDNDYGNNKLLLDKYREYGPKVFYIGFCE